jgi:hypothetical protein
MNMQPPGKKPDRPAPEIPTPLREPGPFPVEEPELPPLPDEDPEIIPDEDPFETPPYEVPEPGEGP